jgi:glycerol-3-phosphate acyltransferase PlsY
MNSAWLIPLAAYLLGSIPFGFLLVKVTQKRDVRGAGSGNIGAANVTRVAGTGAGVLTLLLDAAKGYAAVWLAARWSGGNIRWMMLAALLVIAGHMFPVWLRFRGGKGVATGLGVFLPICAPAVAAAGVVWILSVVFWRYASLGSMAAAASLPIFVYMLYAPGYAPPLAVSLGTVAIALLVIAKHWPNIERLAAGTESRIGFHR